MSAERMMERPTFAPAAEHAKSGFDRIMTGIRMASAAEPHLFNAYLAAVWTGDPRKSQAVLQERLTPEGFTWPWFDDWERRFAATGVWPQSWRNYLWAAEPMSPPRNMESALPLFTLKALRVWLSENGYGEPRLGNTKATFWPAFAVLVSWVSFKSTAEEQYARRRVQDGQVTIIQKVRILEWTLMSSIYAVREHSRAQRAKDIWRWELEGTDRLGDVAAIPEIRVSIDSFDPDRIETFPPYFPGDNIGLWPRRATLRMSSP